MSTDAVTKFADDGDVAFCAFYTQCDGHPTQHGEALKAFLKDFKVVDGLGMEVHDNIANGVECLAAQAIAHFKDGPGHTYMVHADAQDSDYNYAYIITAEAGKPIHLIVRSKDKTLYDGDIKAYKPKD